MKTSIRKMPAAISRKIGQKSSLLIALASVRRNVSTDCTIRSIMPGARPPSIFAPFSPPLGLKLASVSSKASFDSRSRNSEEYGTVMPVSSGAAFSCPVLIAIR